MKQFLTFIFFLTLAQQAWSDEFKDVEAALAGQSEETILAAKEFLNDSPNLDYDTNLIPRFLDKDSYSIQCSSLIGTCEYYLCRENQQSCGEKGYYLGFGYKYCQKSFNHLYTRVSPKGQQWLTDVATCLQQKVESDISPSMECKEIKSASIASHESCYKETNFCGQKFKDVLKVMGLLSPELTKPKMILLGIRIIKNCVF